MARRKPRPPSGDWLLPLASAQDAVEPPSSLLDVVNKVLDKGAVLNGDLVLGVANVDLVYAKLSVLLAAIDKIELRRHEDTPRRQQPRRHQPRRHEDTKKGPRRHEGTRKKKLRARR